MAVHRRLTGLRLDKIAAVDLPCQEHAVVAIVKRAPESGPRAIAKATFQEALQANMTADAVNEAFYQSFDGMWERNDAFRTALTDELAEGGDGSQASADYVASVKQLVDDAVAAAREAGATASNTAPIDKALITAVAGWLESKQQEKPMFKFTTKAALQAAIAKFKPDTSTVQEQIDILDSARELKEEGLLPATGPLAKVAPGGDVAALTATVTRLTKSSSLPVDVRGHYDTLADDAARDAFLAKSLDEQRREMFEKNSGDPVVYKCKDGTEIRKSDGAVAAMLAKQNDGLSQRIDTMMSQLGETSIEKRLVAYPNIAKGVATSMLKAIDLMAEEEKPAALASLAAMNKAQGGIFKRAGFGGDAPEGGDDTGDQMAVIVKRIAKERTISEADATVYAMQNDAEFQALYAEQVAAVPEGRPGPNSVAA